MIETKYHDWRNPIAKTNTKYRFHKRVGKRIPLTLYN